MKLRVWIRSLQIFNVIPLRFSRRLRNSPRPWVKHAQRPTRSDSLENLIRRLNLQCRLIHTLSFIWHLIRTSLIFLKKSGKKNQIN